MNKSLLIRFIVVGFIGGIALYGVFTPQTINADLNNTSNGLSQSTLVQNGRLTFCRLDRSSFGLSRQVTMVVTAYNSEVNQTDEDPLTAASGKQVFDGMIAINGLKFGTRVQIPELFGDKVFIVEDRMHSRKGIYHADVWMENYKDAVDFGAQIAKVHIETPEI